MLNIFVDKQQPKTIEQFLQKWETQELPSQKILYDYKPFCKNLLFFDEKLVLKVIYLLKKNIHLWANKNSNVYKNQIKFYNKKDFEDKNLWYVNSLKNEFRNMSTSGSTSGSPFSYLAWKPFFEFIESNNHYDMILDEYNISNNPQILCFFSNNFDNKNKFIYETENTDNFVHRHGLHRKSNVHHVNLSLYKKNQEEFYCYFFEYIKKSNIDVFFAPGPEINSLCHYIKKLKYKGKIAKLLSNSNEMLLKEDADFLVAEKYVDYICDHMRCWDGGATFFTCKHNNYHLCDNLSWSEEIDGKLITTDYFSLPSPFVNYWNGDLCKIENKYKRCQCGRLYRKFKFLESRPFSIKGQSIEKIKKEIIDIGIASLKQVKCTSLEIEVVTKEDLTELQKEKIKNILQNFKTKFVVEKEQPYVNKINFSLLDKNIECGNATVECVLDKKDASGESYVWEILSGCDRKSSDEYHCLPTELINGTPCVFLGSKTKIPCDVIYKKQKNKKTKKIKPDIVSESENKIIFSLAKCTGTCVYFCVTTNNPVLHTSDCSGGCGCPTLTPIQSQCFSGTAFALGCV